MEAKLFAHLKEIALLEENLALINWDQLTGMPAAAGEFRAELMNYVSSNYFALLTGEQTAELVAYFTANEAKLSAFGQLVFARVKEDFERDRKIPAADMAAFQKTTTEAQDAWMKARSANDYQLYAPYLAKIIGFKRDFVAKWRTDEATPYDVLLNQYEKGLTVAQLDETFAKVKAGVLALRARIAADGVVPNADFLTRRVTKGQQREFSLAAAQRLGYSLEQGRLDDTIHPFMDALNRLDARITTRWDEENFQMAVMGILHEAGHGVYEQNVDGKYDYTPLRGGASMGIHESQSLFQEVMVGRSYAFWEAEFPKLQATVAPTLDDVTLTQFWQAWVKTDATLIRTEADPLTYPLHIMIRYEIEKAIFNDDLDVAELPAVWRAKYKEYLGLDVPDDLTGILQDIHWAGGDFGYFPSYALGHFYAAQMRHAMQAEFDVDAVLRSGDYTPLIDWRREHVWQYGASLTPAQIIEGATGETLNVDYWLTYVTDLYTKAYQL